jgi:hypothetical protein
MSIPPVGTGGAADETQRALVRLADLVYVIRSNLQQARKSRVLILPEWRGQGHQREGGASA